MRQSAIEKDWDNIDHEQLRKYMRYDYKSTALYKCGKNISKLTNIEKYRLLVATFKNFYNSGYSKYSYLFSKLFSETFKNEIEESGKNRFDRFIRFIIK